MYERANFDSVGLAPGADSAELFRIQTFESPVQLDVDQIETEVTDEIDHRRDVDPLRRVGRVSHEGVAAEADQVPPGRSRPER